MTMFSLNLLRHGILLRSGIISGRMTIIMIPMLHELNSLDANLEIPAIG